MEEKLRTFVAAAALRTSKLSKMRSTIMLEHGYYLSFPLIRRLLNRQAFGSQPLKFRFSQGRSSSLSDRPVHVVELDLSEEEHAQESQAKRITILVGEETIEFPISAKTNDILQAALIPHKPPGFPKSP